MLMKYFNESEFRCQCCGKLLLNQTLIDRLDIARGLAQLPFVITSGYRCEANNKEAGGVPGSAHCYGSAADIQAGNSKDRFRIVRALLAAGVRRIGIGKTFVHADVDLEKDQDVLWLYE